jgi:hypothetical protein
MNIKFCIPTCKANAQITLDVLIPSLLDCGIESDQIIVIEGGNNYREHFNNKYSVEYYKTNHNSFDYTALIDIVEYNIESDYYFNIHDTCKVGSKFLSLVQNSDFNFNKIALYHNNMNGASMSMGLINYNYLMQHKQLILSFKNTDYTHQGLKRAKRNAVDVEDSLFWKLDDVLCGAYARGNDRIDLGVQTPYGTNTPRITEYYEPIDLFKYKANWGQTPDFIYNL